MTRSLLGDLDLLSSSHRKDWIDYLASFQDESTGLFKDEALIDSPYFEDCDWWGQRHLAVLVCNALVSLGGKSKYDINFLEPYYDDKYLYDWLNSCNLSQPSNEDDTDNKIMNIGALLQYSRDFFGNKQAGKTLDNLLGWLKVKLNEDSGLWLEYDLSNKQSLSRTIQYAYHLLTLFSYDRKWYADSEKIIDHLLATQNDLGGYGVNLNSSACEDIDTIHLLGIFSKITNYREHDITASLQRSLPWVLANQNNDGGFVFRRNMAFRYGHETMYSEINESSAFATWFRVLSLAYLNRYLNLGYDFRLKRAPGYEF